MSVAQTSTSPTRGELSSEDYTIGIICALPIELAAAVKMLDKKHPRLLQDPGDDNSYRFGLIGDHNVVIGCLAAGRTGLVSATSVALKMKSSFRCVRFGLMVGIGGGVPSEEHDIRLGDVVVSKPAGQHGGVVQYDLGKTRPNGSFERTGLLSPPPDALLTTLTDVEAAQEMDELNIAAHLSQLAQSLPAYGFPAKLTDDLYPPHHLHVGRKTCRDCGKENVVERKERPDNIPAIHYGTIASGNQVMKDAVERDAISQALGGVLCFEMEAAGLMNNFPCLVIRGISDYSDSHKNDGWQRYAAAAAAAFAKELLNHLASTTVKHMQTITQAMDNLSTQLAKNTDVTQQTNRIIEHAAEQRILEWLWPLSNFSKVQNEIRHFRVKDTGDWLLQDLEKLDWYHTGGLIWIHGVVAAVVSFPFIEDVLRICTSVLITVIDGNTRDTIKLAHFTVKEFLIVREGADEGLHWYRFTTRLAHQSITDQAIECVFGHPPASLKNICWYASRFWPAHARAIDRASNSIRCDEVQSRVNSLLQVDRRKQLLAWLPVHYPNESSPQGGVNLPLYYASLLGLESSVIHFWRDSSELKLQNGFYGNALDAAACMGHVEVVMCLTDRLETPSDYFDLARIVQNMRVNVAETIRALLRKGRRPLITTEVVHALTKTSVGGKILQILLEEDLASISINEELVHAATQNKWNRTIVEFLIEWRPREFPLSLQALLAVAGTSLSALQMLIDLRRGEICFNKQDYLQLAKEKSTYNIQKISTLLPSAIPVTTDLIEALASSPSGSQILKFLLDTQVVEHPLTFSAVLMVAEGFNLDTFNSLLRHQWEDNTLTDEIILAIAFNCYLAPPRWTKGSGRVPRANGLFHHEHRPTLMQWHISDSSAALMSLMSKPEYNISPNTRIVECIAQEFDRGVMQHLVKTLAKSSHFNNSNDAMDDRIGDEDEIFHHILETDLGISVHMRDFLKEKYISMQPSGYPEPEQHIIFKAEDAYFRGRDSLMGSRSAAEMLGLEQLPRMLRGLKYSSSEYDEESVIYVLGGWRTVRAVHRTTDRRVPQGRWIDDNRNDLLFWHLRKDFWNDRDDEDDDLPSASFVNALEGFQVAMMDLITRFDSDHETDDNLSDHDPLPVRLQEVCSSIIITNYSIPP
ncbi:hypothetical protein QM012_007944 [Aureobasidium pullulans]|uniref:Nucleoside phosphorylase domain-containing protein n=1 Tax=Aureobasidium pullulans TaxID=5580 RepID=A0ABR0TMP2_AURPU